MEETAILRELVSIVGNDRVRTQEPMSRHTSFRIGGPAEIFVEPTVAQVGRVIARCKEGEIPCTVIGNGSNLLVGDGGIPGVVICLGEQASGISVLPLVVRQPMMEEWEWHQPLVSVSWTVMDRN